jgi:hypothetical protein
VHWLLLCPPTRTSHLRAAGRARSEGIVDLRAHVRRILPDLRPHAMPVRLPVVRRDYLPFISYEIPADVLAHWRHALPALVRQRVVARRVLREQAVAHSWDGAGEARQVRCPSVLRTRSERINGSDFTTAHRSSQSRKLSCQRKRIFWSHLNVKC